jgi:hypothetical protein
MNMDKTLLFDEARFAVIEGKGEVVAQVIGTALFMTYTAMLNQTKEEDMFSDRRYRLFEADHQYTVEEVTGRESGPYSAEKASKIIRCLCGKVECYESGNFSYENPLNLQAGSLKLPLPDIVRTVYKFRVKVIKKFTDTQEIRGVSESSFIRVMVPDGVQSGRYKITCELIEDVSVRG